MVATQEWNLSEKKRIKYLYNSSVHITKDPLKQKKNSLWLTVTQKYHVKDIWTHDKAESEIYTRILYDNFFVRSFFCVDSFCFSESD